MEKLERSLESFDPGRKEVGTTENKPIYKGFRKVEDRAYSDGTSIRYWM